MSCVRGRSACHCHCSRPTPVVAPADPRGGGDARRSTYLERMCAAEEAQSLEKKKGVFGTP